MLDWLPLLPALLGCWAAGNICAKAGVSPAGQHACVSGTIAEVCNGFRDLWKVWGQQTQVLSAQLLMPHVWDYM